VRQHEQKIDHTELHSAGSAAATLFEPDTLLASQHATARPSDSPCRRLVAAVLERALLDAVGPAARQADRDDALAWFGSDDDAPLSFRWVAAQLDFDAQWLRGRVRQRQDTVGHGTAVAAPEAPRVESKVRNAA
jgi:hypothetical protein